MTSLSSEMAKQEIMNPNSPYYAGRPTILDEINGYMNGVSYGGRYSGLTRRNMYIGQPVTDKFESLANAKFSRKSENIFKLIVGGTAALLGALALRKVPGVKPAVNLVGQGFKYLGIAIGKTFQLGWKIIK
ncbi:MAG: hypothetical protein K6A44_01085 [bacterium]|nr:hypothetical protein [bacterium]